MYMYIPNDGCDDDSHQVRLYKISLERLARWRRGAEEGGGGLQGKLTPSESEATPPFVNTSHQQKGHNHLLPVV